MKKIFALILALVMLLTLAGCGGDNDNTVAGGDNPQPCQHQWIDANCINPVTCSLCGEVAGNAIGHHWKEATCTSAKTCIICDLLEGEALGHSWGEATYSKPKTCTLCGITEGQPLPQTSNPDANSNKRQCMWSDCGSTVTRSDSNYCSSHDCLTTGCPYPAKIVHGHTWGERCQFHACQVPDCINNPIGGIIYCIAHDSPSERE